MTISEIKRQLEGLTKAQREQKAIEMIEVFADQVELIFALCAQHGLDFSKFRESPAVLFGVAVALNESFGFVEYGTYSNFCSSAKLSARSYWECQSYQAEAYDCIVAARLILDKVKEFYGMLGQQDVLEKLAFPIACLMYGDNGFTDYGTQYLSLFVD